MMKRVRLLVFPWVVIGVLAALLLQTGGAEAASSAWRVVPSPNPASYLNILTGVTAVSASDAWAVGHRVTSSGLGKTLTLHWNGSQWQVVASPSPSPRSNILRGVAAISAQNVWAVGNYADSSNNSQTLILHWNGTAWSVVKSPNIAGNTNSLQAVAAVSASNVWAVGLTFNFSTGREQTLIEHWNGTSWSIVKSPNTVANHNELYGVAALSATDIWAVGDSYNEGPGRAVPGTVPGPSKTLIEHWNGSAWSIVKSPNPNAGFNVLQGVAAISTKNAWAVGSTRSGALGPGQSLVEHWNGSTWSVVKSPNPINAGDSTLYAVAAVSASNVWAVGAYFNTSGSIYQTLTLHWNGNRWDVVLSPNAGSGDNALRGVARVPMTSKLWAVGYYDGNRTLIETR